jgi:predicted nucleotide-binding protein
LKELKPACARLVTPRAVGTGFVIAGSRLLTCNHVVLGAEQAQCHFGGAGDAIEFRVAQRFEKADIAVLEAVDHAEVRHIRPLAVVAKPVALGNWWAWGFPAILGGQGVPLFGFVTDPEYVDREGRKTIQLFAENLAGDDAQLGGFSGAPVLSGTKVVGMIYRVLAGRTDGKQSRFGMVFAIPITGMNPALGGTAELASGMALPPPDPRPTPEEGEQLRLFGMLESASKTDTVLRVLQAWRANNDVVLPPNVPLMAAEKLLAFGAPRDALAVLANEGDTPRAQQLRALARSLVGQHDQARAILASLPPSGEAGGIAAGVFKRRYVETRNKAWLQGAFDEYERTFQASKEPYPGINAAATALWLGNKKLSRTRAAEVLAILQKKPESERDHWDWASLGEAQMLTGKMSDALWCYQKAVAKDPTRLRDIAVMRKQARISLRELKHPPEKFEQVLAVGGVAWFTGHRVDEPGRQPPRFPRDRVESVAGRIRSELDKRNIHFGFSSAAGGADLLFIEQLLARGGEPTIFLPFPKEEFLETSVGEDWRLRFGAALARVLPCNVHVLLDKKPATRKAEDEAYAACNQAIQNAALEAARIYDEPAVLIAVLASTEARAVALKGGAADTVRAWKEQFPDSQVVVIDPVGTGAKQGSMENTGKPAYRPRIYIHAPYKPDSARAEIKRWILGNIREQGFDPQEFGVSGIPRGDKWSFGRAMEIMRQCDGALILALMRWIDSDGNAQIAVPSEYSHFEGALALSCSLPCLAIAEEGMPMRGILSEAFVLEVPKQNTADWLREGRLLEQPAFERWVERVKARYDVFFGYCSKADELAQNIKRFLVEESGMRVLDWATDFTPGRTIMEEIARATATCRCALFLFTADDPIEGSPTKTTVPRDNVLLEAGYFMSAHTARRMVVVKEKAAKMPADLGGMIYLTIENRADWRETAGEVLKALRKQVSEDV